MKKEILAILFFVICHTGLVYAGSNIFSPYIAIPTGSWPEAVAIGDVNSDGRKDVVMTTSFYFDPDNDYKVFVFLQDSTGSLIAPLKYDTDGTYTNRPETVAIGDVNHDGRPDIVVGNSGMNIEVFLQNSAGGLKPSMSYTTVDSHKVVIGDFNHDELLDVAGIGWGTNTASVLLQKQDRTFAAPVVYSVTHGGYDDLAAGDVNDDGLTDLIVMSGQLYAYPNIGVLHQKAGGTFAAATYYDVGGDILSSGVAVGDVNGDKLQDIVLTYGGNTPSSNIGLFLQNGSGALDPVVSYPSYDCPEPVEVADINQDGRHDIIVAHGGWLALGVYLQNGDSSLAGEELYPLPYATRYNPHGMAIGDINGDKLPDVIIADYNSGLVVLYNQNVAKPSSLRVKPMSSSKIMLAWTDNATGEIGFVVERKSGLCNSANAWSPIAEKDADVINYKDTGLAANTIYSYRIAAFNASTQSPYSNCVSARTATAGTPESPTQLSAVAVTANKVVLTWKDNSSIESSFRIYRKIGKGMWTFLSVTDADAESYTDTNAEGNSSSNAYSYYLIACNSAGCSPDTYPVVIPFSPANLSATAVSPTKIRITWSNLNTSETGFRVLRKHGTCGSTEEWKFLAKKNGNSTSHSDNTVLPGLTYAYKVRAVKTSQAAPYTYGYSRFSRCDTAVTP
jgi:hypothetical protein